MVSFVQEHIQIPFYLESLWDATLMPLYNLFTPPTRTRQEKTVLSCPCRRCEQGGNYSDVNMALNH